MKPKEEVHNEVTEDKRQTTYQDLNDKLDVLLEKIKSRKSSVHKKSAAKIVNS